MHLLGPAVRVAREGSVFRPAEHLFPCQPERKREGSIFHQQTKRQLRAQLDWASTTVLDFVVSATPPVHVLPSRNHRCEEPLSAAPLESETPAPTTAIRYGKVSE